MAEKRRETTNIKSKIRTWGVTPGAYKDKERRRETPNLKGGLTWGTTIQYDKTGEKRNAGTMRRDPNEFLSSPGLFGKPVERRILSKLDSRFVFPPFSVLNARGGDWQQRKRAWIRLGIQSEVGRELPPGGANSIYHGDSKWAGDRRGERSGKRVGRNAPGGSLMPAADYSKSGARGDARGRAISSAWSLGREYSGKPQRKKRGGKNGLLGFSDTIARLKPQAEKEGQGSSIFDPVLCELMYTWFCPPGGMVVDAFAGGSVRGIVASMLGFRYWGSELRPEQIAANEVQREGICPDADLTWVCGDSRLLLSESPRADFLFTCPPYGDLEQYSDDPADLSAMSYEQFIAAYRSIIRRSVKRLRQNRFACIVVGDFRDRKTGVLHGFVGDTVRAFQDAGMSLYNELILITAVGSLSIRASAQFDAGRKIGKTHQNILVFVKGNWKEAAQCALGKTAAHDRKHP